jgi:D-glycero-D-manno-heptose 1,7-bisphosphate phosphatase
MKKAVFLDRDGSTNYSLTLEANQVCLHRGQGKIQKAVFLDRDGTLIQDLGYICRFSQVGFFPFAAEAVRAMNKAGYRVIVVSNQSAVARGICSAAEVERLHRDLGGHFSKAGATISAFYFCPYLADGRVAAYRRDSPLRKPEPGMLLLAARDFSLDLAASVMIGDKVDDILAGQRAGCRTILVRTGRGGESERRFKDLSPGPDLIADDLLAASAMLAGPAPAGDG